MSERDLELARLISRLARERGARADPSGVQTVQVSIDALVHAEVMPFWQAVLGYGDRGGSSEDLLDAGGRAPLLWFQQMDVPRPQRNRIHLDIWAAKDLAEARGRGRRCRRRTAAQRRARVVVLGAGRRGGNEACVCTTM